MINAAGQQVPAVIHLSGVQALVRQLQRRYAPLAQEIQITAISELFHFKRFHQEGTDELIARFDLIVHRAQVQGQVGLPEPIKAWMLLSSLGVGKHNWPLLLSPTQGALPVNAAEYNNFVAYLRRHGHITDRDGNKTIQQPYFWTEPEVTSDVASYWTQTGDTWSQAESAGAGSGAYWGNDMDSASEVAYDEPSTGQSDNDEPIDMSEVLGMTQVKAGETLYLGYRTAKRKFRNFTRRPGRSSKGKGRGKGKGGKKGGFKSTFVAEDSYDADADTDAAYAFTKGKGKGKGFQRRGNPVGPDGKVMTCSGCGSEDHFVRNCSKGKGGGKGSSGSSGGKSGFPATVHWSEQADALPGNPVPSHGYLMQTPTTDVSGNRIFYSDGTIENLDVPANTMPVDGLARYVLPVTQGRAGVSRQVPAHLQTLFQFAWWHSPQAYHASVRLASGKPGLLIDIGAVTNMAGDRWTARQEMLGKEAGQGTVWTDIKTIVLEGVGKQANEAKRQAITPVCMPDGNVGTFTSIVVADSDLPALLGLSSIEQQRGVIDTHTRRMIFPGPGGIQYTLSPGSRVYKLEKSLSGHLLLPCAEWDAKKASQPSSQMAF